MTWRKWMIIVAFALCSALGAAGGVASGWAHGLTVAQIGLPGGIFGNPKDIAVRQALSEFGKSIGAQMPFVISTSDAYPTTALTGAPFAPNNFPANLSSLLRNSVDGTISLPPGDYAFTVDVFCMKAHAHSPSAHQYLVAPLRGSAADVFRALNSRLPSYALNHRTVQVLSWDIQAGMSYAEMRPAQQRIVDQVIPDLKGRLAGDVYERVRGQYQQVVGRVPGMPSFEDAIGRLGSPGQLLLQLQTLRTELMQPPQSYEELARALVPIEAFVPASKGDGGVTPWSRYSDRVLVRFVTGGNYATPGTYQVRVLPPSGSATGGDPPNPKVPVTNVVNNPGTDSVQPLTQTPSGIGQPNPEPSATPEVTIESQTTAEVPENRDRRTLGVGEEVLLTFSGANAHWSLTGGKGSVEPNGKSVIYTASITAATETITAVDTSTAAKATIQFTVILPTAVMDEVIPNSIKHEHDRPDSGMRVHVYFQPDTVSFEYIDVIERDIPSVATGVYKPFNGDGHDPNKKALPMDKVVPGKGTEWLPVDNIYSGDPATGAPFTPGSISFQIPYVYGSVSTGRKGPFYNMMVVPQESLLDKDGVTLKSTKAGATITTSVSNATGT